MVQALRPPTTGGTAFLIKWPNYSVWQSAACATGDNVNECALSFSTALANGTTGTTQTSTDNSTSLATDAFVQTVVSGASSRPPVGDAQLRAPWQPPRTLVGRLRLALMIRGQPGWPETICPTWPPRLRSPSRRLAGLG